MNPGLLDISLAWCCSHPVQNRKIDAPETRSQRGSFLRVWLLFTGILTALTACWSLATPLPSGPDESTHVIKAASVARGTLIGSHPAHAPVNVTKVQVPRSVASLAEGTRCYYRHQKVSAACRVAPKHSAGNTAAATYVGYYPPLYYAVTGLPSLLSTARWALYGMRITSALFGSALLGLAFASAVCWSRRRVLVIGLALGVTPTTIYLMSVLNPNGLEIAAAAAVWVSGLILFDERPGDPPQGLLTALAVSGVVLALTRPLSPAWLFVIVLTLVILRPRAVRQLVASAQVRIAAAALAVGVLVSGVYVLVERSYTVEAINPMAGSPTRDVLRRIVRLLPAYTKELIGAYGAPEFRAPALAVAFIVPALFVLLGTALLVARRRDARVLALMSVGFLIALPVAVSLVSAPAHGLVWQARYGLPLMIGIPLVASQLLGELPAVRAVRTRVAVGTVVAVSLFVSLAWVFHRYSVGVSGSLNPFAGGPDVWRPPLPVLLLAISALLANLGYGWLIYSYSAAPMGGAPHADSHERDRDDVEGAKPAIVLHTVSTQAGRGRSGSHLARPVSH